MNISSRFFQVLKILKSEPEYWIAYLYGYNYKNFQSNNYLIQKGSNLFVRYLRYIFTIFKKIEYQEIKNNHNVDILFFAGTLNQIKALEGIYSNLCDSIENIKFLIPKYLKNYKLNNLKKNIYIDYTFNDLINTIFINLCRMKFLFSVSKEFGYNTIYRNFEMFLSTHLELIYFERLINALNPKYIILSNDHSVKNLALLAIVNSKNIKTIYIQHAFISSYFPALNFDYSFLYGMESLNTYKQCEDNRLETSIKKRTRVVYLCGIPGSKLIKKDKNIYIGLCFNSLDSTIEIEMLVRKLVNDFSNIIIRFHPRMDKNTIYDIKKSLIKYKLSYSDPYNESISIFFSKTKCIIAGDSSIHLEAALAGIPSIYYNIKSSSQDDYYKFVKNKLIPSAKNYEDIKSILKKINRYKYSEKTLKKYCETYGTKYFNREEKLISEVIFDLYSNKNPRRKRIIL